MFDNELSLLELVMTLSRSLSKVTNSSVCQLVLYIINKCPTVLNGGFLKSVALPDYLLCKVYINFNVSYSDPADLYFTSVYPMMDYC